MNKKWINSALNCKAYSSFERVSSDLRIATAKIRLSLRRNAKQATETVNSSWSLLNNRDISNKYMITLKKKFDALQEKLETLTPNEEYENFVNAHMKLAALFIPTKLRAKHRVPRETLAVKKKVTT